MLTHESILGQPGEGVYAQVTITGNYFVVLKLQGSPEKVTLELGRNFISKIEEVISQTPEISPSELVDVIKSEGSEDINISILAAFIPNQTMIAAMEGDISAKIIRDGKIITLNQASVSGNLLQGDIAILGSKSLFEKINLVELLSQSDKKPGEIKEFLLPQIEQKGDGPDTVGIILRLDLNENSDKIEETGIEAEGETPSEQPSPTLEKKSLVPTGLLGLKRFIPTKENIVYLKQAREKGFESAPPKKTLYLVVLAFVILISVVAFQLRSRSLEVQNQNVTRIEKEANEAISSSSKLIGLNDQLAREALTQKKDEIVSQIESDFGSDWKKLNTKEGERLRAVVGKLDSEIARAANINNVKLVDFFDFSILKDEPNITSAQLHDGMMVVLDSANGSVYTLEIANKSGSIVGGGNFDDESYVDFSVEELFVFDSPNVRQKNLNSNSAFRNVAKEATNSGKIASLGAFAGNIYLLDPSSSEIWKFQGTEEGTFAAATSYIQPGLNLDLASAKGMTIDGFIYVFDKDNIWKFSSGAPEQFELEKLAAPLGSIDSMFSSEDSKNIYVWDATNNRIVVVDKKGIYQAQYQLPALKNSSSALVLADEEQKKIFLVLGAKVYGMDIK